MGTCVTIRTFPSKESRTIGRNTNTTRLSCLQTYEQSTGSNETVNWSMGSFGLQYIPPVKLQVPTHTWYLLDGSDSVSRNHGFLKSVFDSSLLLYRPWYFVIRTTTGTSLLLGLSLFKSISKYAICIFLTHNHGNSVDGSCGLQHIAFPLHPSRPGRRTRADPAPRCLPRACSELYHVTGRRISVYRNVTASRCLFAESKALGSTTISDTKF